MWIVRYLPLRTVGHFSVTVWPRAVANGPVLLMHTVLILSTASVLLGSLLPTRTSMSFIRLKVASFRTVMVTAAARRREGLTPRWTGGSAKKSTGSARGRAVTYQEKQQASAGLGMGQQRQDIVQATSRSI